MSHDDKSGVFGLLCGDRLLHCTTLCKGTLPEKKYFFFRSLPELSPPPSFQATSTSILDVKNDVLRVCQKIINYDNDGCKYNYDGNFDDNDDKKLPDNNIKDFG